MLIVLNLVVDKDIPFTEKFDRILNIEEIRDFVIKMSNNEEDSIRGILNHSSHSIPKIIYARPHKNKIKIYGIGDDGSRAIKRLQEMFRDKKSIVIKNKRYEIRQSFVTDNLQFLPRSTEIKNRYTTLTPLCVINKYNQRTYQWIVGKNFGDGKYIQHGTEEQLKSFYKDIEEFTSNQIRDYIKYMLSQLFKGKNKDDFKFADNIIIEWESINIIHHHYHTEEKSIPMVTGQFTTNYELPKFVGYKIGKGFGELLLKSNKVA